jgi:hypothetical protein
LISSSISARTRARIDPLVMLESVAHK